MPLTAPILDDRTYAQLKEELVRRIPVYTPEWTDYNETDPGIALVELFAYLGESLLYRFNQIPDATKIAFLRLLGVQPRPAQSARTSLRLETERPEGVQVLRGVAAPAGAVPFETDDEVYVWPVDLVGAVKVRAPEPAGSDAAKAAERRRRADAATGHGVPTGAAYDVYVTRLVPDDPADPAAESVEVGATLDQSLWVAVLGKATTDLAQMRGRTLFVGVAVDETLERPYALEPIKQNDPARLPAGRLTADPPAMLWELWVEGGPAVTLRVSGDTTRGLTTTGVVKVDLPQDFPTQAAAAPTPGDRDAPPPLDDKRAKQVVAWLRVRRPASEDETMRKIRWVGANVVGVVQARTAVPELLGTGTSEAGQVYRLSQRPVVAGSLKLEVEEADGWTPWEEVRTLATSGALDRHYTLELDTGLVRFGVRSRVPQLGERIRALTYRYGGGSAGQVAAGAISSLVGVASVKVTNPLPAVGGADAASLVEALDTVPAEVHRRDRAVVAEDFRALALEVPGVVRADARPLLHPDTPRRPAAGVVSVVVFPADDPREPGAPLPEVSLLRRVAAYLNPRRLMTTELYVIPPTYVDIAVSVGVAVKQGYQVDAVRRWVEQLLRQYLSPLPPNGPDGQGWPLGRAVRRAELEAVSVQVAGVEYVEDELLLAVPDASGGWTPTPLVQLDPWEVPRIAHLAVVSGPPLPPGSGYAAPPKPDDLPLVPLPPDVCS
jgi:predicted phage baseplate assembly protein